MGVNSVYAISSGFANPVKVSVNNTDSQTPQEIISENGIFAVWVATSYGRSDIIFSKSTDGGITFTNPIILSGSTSGQSNYPSLAQNGNNVYVVWQSSTSGNSTIFFVKSSDDGNTFDKPMRISEISQNSAFPQIAISNTHVYSTWIEKSENGYTNIVVVNSADMGKSFASPLQITNHTGNSGIPKITASESNVYLMWEDNSKGHFEIFLSKSKDYANTFDSPLVVSNVAGQSGAPQILVSKNNIYAVWMGSTSGSYDIMFAKSVDGGQSFNKPVNVSNTVLDSGYPQFTVSGSNIYVTWTETMPNANYDILFAKSTDAGATFDKPINLSKNLGESGWPKIATDGNIYVSWVDNSTGNFDILITKSTDSGLTFQNPLDMSSTTGESYYNDMKTSGNVVYMIWQESEQGKHNIVFSKSTTFVPEFGHLSTIVLVVSIMSTLVLSSSKLKLRI